MYIATHNIWDTDKADVIGRQVARNSVLCGVQELGEGPKGEQEYWKFIDGLGPNWSTINAGSKTPFVFNNTRLRLADPRECPPGFQFRGILKLHDGTDFTPSRDLSWMITKDLSYPNLPPVAWIDVHLQHRAWNGKERDPRKLAIRKELWWAGYEQSQWVFVNFLRHGLTTVLMGDFNRRNKLVPKFTPRQHYVAGTDNGIDGIVVAKGWGPKAANVKVHADKAKRIDTPSDHPLIVGNLQFLMP